MTETVTIACKLPHGLDLGPDHNIDDGTQTGKRNGEAVARTLGGKRIVLNGSNSPGAIGGYGLTSGIDKAFWTAWREANKDYAPVKNGFIFAHDREAMVLGQAAEQSGLRNGFEPLNTTPGADPRMPRPPEGVSLEATDETKAEMAKFNPKG